ncbi:hypothetical protein Nepgr_016243 [Nepenthes gracilis]|uniref:Uncharacterized protein n=1 Tax=Nepenthes gracilis TaxID=150966 RepID=A0AAD3SPW6_NEPGR|nr:hypothetical protein Nepgr_016243 [Nepenthes gracilis]
MPNGLFGSPELNVSNSPMSPFSTRFDFDTVTAFSDNQQQQSSKQYLSGTSSSSDSPFETSSYHLQSSPSVDYYQEIVAPPLSSDGALFWQTSSSGHSLKHALQELETALMETDGEDVEVTASNSSLGESRLPQIPGPLGPFFMRRKTDDNVPTEKRHKAGEESSSFQSMPSGNLRQLLIACAKSLSENRFDNFERLVSQARAAVSITGEPIQRLGAYMIEGLVARKESSGNNISRALRCREPLANGAIAEACKNENRIHIVDFQIAQGTQWVTLLQALAARPSGAPHVRITGIDDPVSKYARGANLEAVGKRLEAISSKFLIPVEFHTVPVFGPDVTRDMLDVREGEALAVNFPLELHHTPDESVDVNNPRDGLLRMVKSLSPNVVTLVEQESNTNTTPFFTRFVEALDYYSAMFESIDVTMRRDSKERINIEQHCLAKDIVNVVACEGKERVERHELFGKWKSRFTMAGFRQYPLSSYVNSVIRGLLRCYSEHYTLEEKDGAMLLGWKERMLISASAWQ